MSEETTATAGAQPGPVATATVNAPTPDIALGLTGVWKLAANLGGAVLIAGAFLTVGFFILSEFRTMLHDARQDRLDDRQTFREAIKGMNDEQNRRAGEIKGSVDKNSEIMRDLITEIRAWRTTRSTLPPTTKPPDLKPIGP